MQQKIKLKNMKTIIYSLSVIFHLLWCHNGNCQKPKTGTDINVTYISNCGFLIQIKDKKLLFDIESPDKAFDKQTVLKVYELLYENKAPFNDINAVFISHSHSDHFGAEELSKYMAENSKVKLYTVQNVNEEMVKTGHFKSIENRIYVVDPYETGIVTQNIDNINVDFLGLYHAGAPNYISKDFSFVISYGGVNIFYMSDIDPSYADNLKVVKKWSDKCIKIDLFFTPDVNLFPNQWSPFGYEVIRDIIKPKKIIATHLDPKAIDESEKKIKDFFSDVIIFKKSLETFCIPSFIE